MEKTNERNKFNEQMASAVNLLEKRNKRRSQNQMNVTLTRGATKRIQNCIGALPVEERSNIRKIIEKIAESLETDHCQGDLSEDNGTLEYQSRRQGFSTTLEIKDRVEVYIQKYGIRC